MAAIQPVYFDSALIAKFYLNESGRDEIRKLAAGAGKVASSSIAVAEVSAAFHRKWREGGIKPADFNALRGQFQHDLSDGLWSLVPITDDLLGAAQDLFGALDAKTFLRSLDALHLVTAKSEGFQQIYSNDRHLLAASSKAALKGINPLA